LDLSSINRDLNYYLISFLTGATSVEKRKYWTTRKVINIVENLILIACGIFVLYLYVKKDKSKSFKTALKSNHIHDIINYQTITPDGLIVLDGNRFRIMVEVMPTNLPIKAPTEQAMVWEEYRNTIQSINVDWTKIIQTRIMQISEHLDEVKDNCNAIKSKYPELYAYGMETYNAMKSEYEEKGKRDLKYFIILKIDAEDFKAADNNLTISNEAVGALMSGLGSSKKYSDEELKTVAINELNNALNLLISGLFKANIIAKPMNKKQVLDFINNTLNRDIANIQSIDAMDKSGVFHFAPTSLTVDLFMSKAAIETMSEEPEIEFLYTDEEIERKEEEDTDEETVWKLETKAE